MASGLDILRARWAAEDKAKVKRRKAKAAEKDDDGGLLGSLKGFVSDVTPELGIGNAFDMLTSIPAGIGYIGSAALPGGVAAGEGIGNVGKGLAHSFENTLSTVAEPAFDAIGQQKRYAQGWRKVNNALFPDDEMETPHGLIHRSFDKDQGLLPAIIEDVGNVAIVGAPAARAAKVGDLGKVAAVQAIDEIAASGGASTRLARSAAKWTAKEAKMAERIGPEAHAALKESAALPGRVKGIKITESMAHPYETAFRRTIGRSGMAAQAAQKIYAARTGAELAKDAGDATRVEALDFSGSGTKTPGEWDADLEARSIEADVRAGRGATPRTKPTAGVQPGPQVARDKPDWVYEPSPGHDATGAADAALGNQTMGTPLSPEQLAAEKAFLESQQGQVGNDYVRVNEQGASGPGRRASDVVGPREPQTFAELDRRTLSGEDYLKANPERRLAARRAAVEVNIPDDVRATMEARAQMYEATGQQELADAVRREYTDASMPAPRTPAEEAALTKTLEVDPRAEPAVTGRADEILDAEGNPIEPIQAKVGPVEEAAITRKATAPPEGLLERHLARLEGEGPGARLTNAQAKVQGYLDSRTLRAVNREGERFVEAARRIERNAPWYQQAMTVAREHLVNQVNPETGARISSQQADEMLGAEAISRLEGIEMLNQAAKEMVGEGWDPAVYFEFMKKINAKRSSIPEEMMTPELDAQLDEIANLYRERSKTRVGTLIGDRLGTTGLQNMNDNAPTMTKAQSKQYAQIKKAAQHQATVGARRIAKEREKVARQVATIQDDIDKAGRDIEALNTEADELDQVAQGLLSYTPALLTDTRRPGFLDEIVSRTLADEGTIANPSATTSKAFAPTAGWTSSMQPGTSRRVRLAEFGPEAVEEVYQANKNFLTDPDAKIGTWVRTLDEATMTDADRAAGFVPGEQIVDIDIVQNTLGSTPMQRWQAKILGQARGQESVSGPQGQTLHLPRSPEAQQVAAVYRPLIRNPRSQVNRTLRGLHDVLDRYEVGSVGHRLTMERIDVLMNEAMNAGARLSANTDELDAFFKSWREALERDPAGSLVAHEKALQKAVDQAPAQQALPLSSSEKFNLHEPKTTGSTHQNILNTRVHPDETATAAKIRTYKATRAADDARVARMKVTATRNRITRLQAQREQLATVLKDQTTTAEIEGARTSRDLQRKIARLGKQLQDPATGNVPAKWQPMWDAFKRIVREAETNPALELPDGWVDQFASVLEVAARNGFDPQHIRSFTPKQVENLMFGQMRLGGGMKDAGTQLKAGTRTTRVRPHPVAQSVSALAAAMVEVVHESQTNHLVDFIEQNLAAKVVKGYIPNGWVAWDPVRNFIKTGEKIEKGGRVVETLGATPTMMVPQAVANTIRNLGKDYSHWAFKALSKVQDPWRALILTMTPRWYVNNFLGNFILTTASGVRLDDWLRAWHEYRQREFTGQDLSQIGGSELARGAVRDVRQLRKGRNAQPFTDIPGVTGASIYSDLADPNALMLPKGIREKARYIAGTKDRNRVVTAYKLGIAKLSRANEVVDELARASVYFSATRKGASPETALMRAYEALVDYGDLSPIERQMVRSVIPFYSWQKGILKLVVKNGIEHPAAAAIILQLDRLSDEWLKDQYGTELPSGYAGLLPFGDGAVNTRGLNPFADAGALVTAQGIARSMNPFAESIVRSELGAPEGGIVKDQRVNEYGRLVPEVNISEDLGTNVVGALPQVQLGQRITGTSPSPYEEPLTRSFGRYAGVPIMTEGEVQRTVERTTESRATLKGPKAKKRKRKKAASPLDKMLARLKKPSDALK